MPLTLTHKKIQSTLGSFATIKAMTRTREDIRLTSLARTAG
jgi:hypothetical protein